MMLALPLSFVAPAAVGFVTASVLWPRRGPLLLDLLLRACLAVGLGLGICSCGFFVWSLVFGQAGGGFAVAETVLTVGAIAAHVLARRRWPGPERPPELAPDRDLKPWARRALWGALCISLALAVAVFVLRSLAYPHGVGDAFAVWNLRARFFFRGGERWTDAFSTHTAHPHYPLLVSLSIARCWKYAGSEALIVPALIAMLFTFATVGLTFSALAAIRGRNQAVIGALVLLCTPFLILQGTWQYADVPVGLYFLATMVLLCFHDRSPDGSPGLLVSAGLTAGLATWTKNEGLLFLVSLCVARLAVVVRTGVEWKTWLREMLLFAAGLMPVLIITAYLKMRLAPGGVWLSAGLQSALAGVGDMSRWYVIIRAFVRKAISFGLWRVSLSLFLLVYLGLLGVRIPDRDKRGVAASFITLGLMLVGYFLAYLTTPLGIEGHLRTSVNRLFLQLWPSYVFVFFLLVRAPEEAVSRQASPRGTAPGQRQSPAAIRL